MEENNNEIQLESKKDNGVKILLIILIVLAVAILALLSYKIFVLDNKQNNNEVEVKKDENRQEDNEVEEDIAKISEDLFNKYVNNKFLTPIGSQMFIGNMENGAKLVAALVNINLKEKEDYDYEKCSSTWYDEDDTLDPLCIINETDKDVFEESYKELFGNKDIKYETFYHNLNTCKLEGNKINCYAGLGGYEGGHTEVVKLDSYKLNDNKLLLKVDVINIEMGNIITSNTLDMENAVTVSEEFNDNINAPHVNMDDATKNKFFEKYGDYAVSYTMTFEKNNEDNNYYFVSFEENK